MVEKTDTFDVELCDWVRRLVFECSGKAMTFTTHFIDLIRRLMILSRDILNGLLEVLLNSGKGIMNGCWGFLRRD